MNVVYRGIKNDVTIYFPQSDSIKVTGKDAIIQKETENNYSIIPSVGNLVEIKISGFFKGKEIIDKREFRILNIDNPFASINNRIEQITLSKEELAHSSIKYFIPQFVINLGKIAKFQYKINDKEPMVNGGEEFNNSAKKEIYEMKSGDSMIIDDLHFNFESPNIDLKKVTELKVLIK